MPQAAIQSISRPRKQRHVSFLLHTTTALTDPFLFSFLPLLASDLHMCMILLPRSGDTPKMMPYTGIYERQRPILACVRRIMRYHPTGSVKLH
ncbi:uncharacterized protein BO66DRAFT_101608 [Aspergillus aculeatinus CBS 121060]|uniref:Uncharacterized protein n=1 Tax=Aspergillus aculeatinus CBS 121060 TaxID=1448322 RepID=A0ACD1H7A7_9EURO|nr:hypothetical protein BO66DRAFT_101608 [Aspergillus aculeatinus CBS 121060]RAH69474.1 hypothetical protein BO66DRAFT_101608 [Aspergillus aculeatinus CBS 121060]